MRLNPTSATLKARIAMILATAAATLALVGVTAAPAQAAPEVPDPVVSTDNTPWG